MAFLQDFYIQALKNKKAKTNDQLDFKNKPGVDYKGDVDFFGSFLSVTSPEAAQQINQLSTDTKKKITDNALKSGMSMENINNTLTGQPLNETQQTGGNLLDKAGNLVTGLVSSYERAGKSIGDSLAYGSKDATSAREAQQRAMDMDREIIAKAGQQLRDPSVSEEKKVRLRQLIKNISGDTSIYDAAQQESARVQEQLDPVKNVAAIGNIGMDIATLGTVGGATKAANLGRQVATGAAQGATAGVFGAYEQGGKDTTLKDVATGATIGGVLGGGLTAGTGKLSQWLGDKQAAKTAAREALKTQAINGEMDSAALKAINAMDAEDAFMKSQGITNPARLLPDGTQSKAARLIEIDNELDIIKTGKPKTYDPELLSKETTNSLLADPSTKFDKPNRLQGDGLSYSEAKTGISKVGRDVKDRIIIGKNDKGQIILRDGTHLLEAHRELGLPIPADKVKFEDGVNLLNTPDGSTVKVLAKERSQLVKEIDAIKNPVNRAAEQINLLDGELQKAQNAGDTVLVQKLQQQSDFMAQEAQRIDNIDSYVSGGNKKVAGQARTTEADAIKANLTDGIDKAMYDSTNWDYQTSGATKLVNENPEMAYKVAFNNEQAPNGLLNNAVIEAVKQKAIRENDLGLIKRLAISDANKTTSRAAQELGVLGANRNSLDPVNALQDIVKARKTSALSIPATVTEEEVAKITKMSGALEELKGKLGDNPTQATRDAYGAAYVQYDNYVKALMESANKKTLKQHFSSFGETYNTAIDIAGVTKSMNATFDNSFGLKQGWKVMTTHPAIWAKAWGKSWVNIAKTLKGAEVMDGVHARIASDEFMLNGKFKDYKIELPGMKGYKGEEFFPSQALEKIPGVGRLFKASDVAYTAMQLDMRMNLAKALITKAENSGIVDISNPKERAAIGNLINSMTGRGHLGKLEPAARTLNNVFFSPRFAKSNIDALGGHLLTGAGGKGVITGAGGFVRREAAMNLLKMTALAGTTLAIADSLIPGSVEWDPRSSDAGKIKIGNTRFDVTGGMGSFVTMYARQATGKTKSSSTGELKSYNSGDPYADTRWDALWKFTENKFSPAAGAVRDILRGEDFGGNETTAKSVAANLVTPMMIKNFSELRSTPNSAPLMLGMVADGLGISTNSYDNSTDWNTKRSQGSAELRGFKQKVGEDKFKKANDEYNKKYNEWFSTIRQDPKFWKLSLDERTQYVTTIKQKTRDDVLKNYGYEYKKAKRTNQTQSIINELDKYKK